MAKTMVEVCSDGQLYEIDTERGRKERWWCHRPSWGYKNACLFMSRCGDCWRESASTCPYSYGNKPDMRGVAEMMGADENCDKCNVRFVCYTGRNLNACSNE